MAIKCWKKDCKFRDERGYCELGYIEINEKGECVEYEPDPRKEIIEHNEKHVKAIERIMNSDNIPEKTKDMLVLLHILTMKTDKGTLVVDEMFPDEKERGDDERTIVHRKV